MVAQSVAVYPIHDEMIDTTKGPRVTDQGEPNYVRNKGTIKVKVFDPTAHLVKTPKPEPRCPTAECKDNYKAGWFGTIPPLMNGTSSPRPNTAPARVKPEAQATCYISRGPRMKVIVHEYAKSRPTPRQPRVKPEGQNVAEISKGGRMIKIMHKYDSIPRSSCPVPRLNLDGEPTISADNQGKRMSDNLHKYGQMKASSRPVPRVTAEGEPNAELDRGRRMETLFKRYGRCPLSSRAVPRVKQEGEPNATLGSGFRMRRLVHDPNSVPATPRPVLRTSTPQAKSNYIKGRGSMDAIFQNIAKKTFIYVPGQQLKMYTRASIE